MHHHPNYYSYIPLYCCYCYCTHTTAATARFSIPPATTTRVHVYHQTELDELKREGALSYNKRTNKNHQVEEVTETSPPPPHTHTHVQ